MKKIFISLFLSSLLFTNAYAVTLYQALNETYKNNTQLNAERENIKAAEEDINISQADYLPSVSLNGSKSFENTNEITTQGGADASVSDVNPLSSSIKLEQTVSNNSAVIEKKPAELKNKSPKYKVLLHNDPVNSMEYVTISLREVVPQLSEQDAIAIMLEAHNTGVGLVIVCDLEPAEFYSESLKSKGISSSIEKED